MVVANTRDPTAQQATHEEYPLVRQYRVPANIVHAHLLDLLAHGQRTFDLSEPDSGHGDVRHMLRLGGRYAPPPEGELDSTGSTSEDLTLAFELTRLVPAQTSMFRDKPLNMRDWVDCADRVLTVIENKQSLASLDESEQIFAREELRPFLEHIMSLPPGEPVE